MPPFEGQEVGRDPERDVEEENRVLDPLEILDRIPQVQKDVREGRSITRRERREAA